MAGPKYIEDLRDESGLRSTPLSTRCYWLDSCNQKQALRRDSIREVPRRKERMSLDQRGSRSRRGNLEVNPRKRWNRSDCGGSDHLENSKLPLRSLSRC